MPTATSTKRVKNTRISRPFIIGSEAWPLTPSTRPPNTPPDHTKGWRVYIRAPPGQPLLTTWLKKVQFKIYHTYSSPTRLIESPPFQIEETGWGGFNVEIRLFFAPEVGSKPEYRNHFLQLETYGSEEQQRKQVQDGMVRSEFLEYVEFNEPTEAAWEALTDAEGQWPRVPPAKGKGKQKAVNLYAGGTTTGIMGEGTVDLAERTTEENPFSKQLEQQILAVLRKAEKDVEGELEEAKKDRERIAKELAEVRTGLGLS